MTSFDQNRTLLNGSDKQFSDGSQRDDKPFFLGVYITGVFFSVDFYFQRLNVTLAVNQRLQLMIAMATRWDSISVVERMKVPPRSRPRGDPRATNPVSVRVMEFARRVLGTENGYGRGFPWTIFATATLSFHRRADYCASTNLYPSIDRVFEGGQPPGRFKTTMHYSR